MTTQKNGIKSLVLTVFLLYCCIQEIYPGQFAPSKSHRFIHHLERDGRLLRNYTQNIDTLEQAAGISQVVQCHGMLCQSIKCSICEVLRGTSGWPLPGEP